MSTGVTLSGFNSATRSITIPADPARVFAYASEAQRLPEWAPGFASAVRSDGEDFIAESAGGERRFQLRTSAEFGVVDFVGIPAPGRFFTGATLRIIPYPRGSETLFTLLRLPGESDDAFDVRLSVVDEELATLRDRVVDGIP